MICHEKVKKGMGGKDKVAMFSMKNSLITPHLLKFLDAKTEEEAAALKAEIV
jgi:hypothetical protein